MNKLIGSLLVAGLLSGCIIRTHDRGRGSPRRTSTSCPPAYHWNGYQCVHNGRARGHDKRH